MRGFAMTVAAVSMFAVMGATAQADALHGAPIKQGNKCWTMQKFTSDGDSRWGYWADCPATASATVATTPRVTRRNRASSR
jgi:hypothetical protein